MHLDSPEALGVLNTLFETVAPSSLRPVDMLLKSMFVTPATMVSLLSFETYTHTHTHTHTQTRGLHYSYYLVCIYHKSPIELLV